MLSIVFAMFVMLRLRCVTFNINLKRNQTAKRPKHIQEISLSLINGNCWSKTFEGCLFDCYAGHRLHHHRRQPLPTPRLLYQITFVLQEKFPEIKLIHTRTEKELTTVKHNSGNPLSMCACMLCHCVEFST